MAPAFPPPPPPAKRPMSKRAAEESARAFRSMHALARPDPVLQRRREEPSGPSLWPVFIMSIAMTLFGCTTVPTETDSRGYKWELVDKPIAPVVHRITDGNVYLHCAFEEKAVACSVRRDVCDIYVADDAEDWVIEHEMKHCAGWRH